MELSRGRRFLRFSIRAVLFLACLGSGFLLAIQVDSIGRLFFLGIGRLASPDWVSLEAERVSGSWVRTLALQGVRLQDTRNGNTLALDSLRLSYHPLSWRPGRLKFGTVEAAGVTVLAHEPARDSIEPRRERRDSDGNGADELDPWIVVLDELELRRGGLRWVSSTGEAFHLNGARASLSRLRIGREWEVSYWEIQARFTPSGKVTGWGRVSGSGALSAGEIRLDSLSVRSPRSQIEGSGRIPLDGTLTQPGGLRWNLRASPLALADLQGLARVPGVIMGDSLFLTTRTVESGDSAWIFVDGNTSTGAAGWGQIHWGREGSLWAGTAELKVEGFEPRRYLGNRWPDGPVSGAADGNLELNLGSGRLQALAGTGSLHLTSPQFALTGMTSLSRIEPGQAQSLDSLAIRVDSLRWGAARFSRGRMSASRAGGRVDWEMEVETTEGGSLRGNGTVTGFESDEPLSYSGRLSVDSLPHLPSSSLLSGSLDFRAEGLNAFTATGGLDLTLSSSSVGSWPVDSATVVLALHQGAADLQGEARGPYGSFLFDTEIRVSPSEGEIRLSSLTFDSVRSPAQIGWVGLFPLSGNLAGRLGWDGPPLAALNPHQLVGSIQFSLPRVEFGSLPVDSARGEFFWDKGGGEAFVRGKLPGEGSLDLELEGQFLDTVDLVLREARFQGVDLGRIVPGSPSSSLRGKAEGHYGRGSQAAEASAALNLSLEPSRFAGDSVSSLLGEVRWSPDTLLGDLQATLGGGTLRGQFTGFREEGAALRWSADADARLPNLGGFFRRPDSSVAFEGRVSAVGSGADVADEVEFEVFSAKGWGGRLDTLVASGRLDRLAIAFDTVLLRSNVLNASGAGAFPLALLGLSPRQESGDAKIPFDQPVEVSMDHPGFDSEEGRTPPFQKPLPGGFLFQATIPDSGAALRLADDVGLTAEGGELVLAGDCAAGRCTLGGSLELGPVFYGTHSVASTRLELSGRSGEGPAWAALAGRLELEGMRSRTYVIRSAGIDAFFNGEETSIEASTVVDDQRDGTVSLGLKTNPTGRLVTVRAAQFRKEDTRWTLIRPASLTFDEAGLLSDTLELRSGRGQFLAFGAWREGNRSLGLRLDSVAVGAFSDLLGFPGLDGWLDGDLNARDDGSGLSFDAHAFADLAYRGSPLHRLRLEAKEAGGYLTLDASVEDTLARSRARVVGSIPHRPYEGGTWDLDVQMDSLPLGWLEPYLPESNVDGLGGSMASSLTIQGPGAAPTVMGPLEIVGGRIFLAGPRVVISDVRLKGSAQGRTFTLDSLSAVSEGRLMAQGTFAFPSLTEPVGLDLRVSADRFLLVDNRSLSTQVTGDVTLTGTSRFPMLGGSLEVEEGTLRVDGGSVGGKPEEVSLTEEDWRILRSRFGISPPSQGALAELLPQDMDLDLSVSLGRNIWLRQDWNPRMAIQFTGAFEVQKRVEWDDLRLQGRLQAIPQRSSLEQFGRRFQIEEGSLEFLGPASQTRLDVVSAYRVPMERGESSEITIRMNLAGQPSDYQLTLSSDPSMETSDMVSYLATGRPASSAFSGQGGGYAAAEVGAGIVAEQISGLLDRFARVQDGPSLDVLEVRAEGLREAELVAGKYVTPRLFLGFRQPVSFERGSAGPGDTQAEAEWRAMRWLLANLQAGGAAFRFILEGSFGY